MYQIDFHKPLSIHFIGIGGISMSGLAEILLEEGFTISGSDSKKSPLTSLLESKGAKIYYGQRASNISDSVQVVVYTAAIHPDNPEFACAKEKGIPVVNVPTYGTQIVGQYALGLLLEICSHYGHHDECVKEGKWENNPDWCFWDYPMIELYGKTAGIIGLGRIGQATAKLLNALDMEVIAYDAHESEAGKKLAEYVSLDELFARSDVVFLHCPLFPATEGIINKENIAKMKDGVILINNSRGQLVVEQDLADALNSGKVYAAGLDVVSTEPIKGDNPLLTAKNCIITPHISWAAQASRQRIMDITADNLKAFVEGNPVNIVNK